MKESARRSSSYAADLARLAFSAWQSFDQPRGALAFALQALVTGCSRDEVLEDWLKRSDIPVWLCDSVVFDVLRTQSVASETAARWFAFAERTAVATSDPSLVETLLWVLGRQALEHGELAELAGEVAKTNAKVRRALEAAAPTPSSG